MDEEPIDWKAANLPLNLLGLAACAVAIFASGGLAILAGAAAIACLAGSVAASLMADDSPCERYWRECDQAQPPANAEPSAGPSQEAGQCHQWQQAVAASRAGNRHR